MRRLASPSSLQCGFESPLMYYLDVRHAMEKLLHEVPEQEHNGENERPDGIPEEAVLPA